MSFKLKYITAGLKTLSSITRNKLFGCRSPLLSYLLVTNRCNLDCVYCYSEEHKSENLDIPFEELCQVIDQLKESGTILVSIMGGEPTIRRDLGKIIDYISKRGMMVELLTSGYYLERHLNSMNNLDFLAISIDGDESAHEKNRGVGSYKAAMHALELAHQQGIHTRIHVTLTRENEDSLDHVMDIARKYNVKVNSAVASKHRDNPALLFDNEKIKDYYRKMREYLASGYPISNAKVTVDYMINWQGNYDYVSDRPHDKLPYLPCKRKDFSFYLDANGDAYPCVPVWAQYKFNIKDHGVQGAFDEFQKITCTNCIMEAEFNHLFNGSLSSLFNMIAIGLVDKLKNIFSGAQIEEPELER